MAPQIFFESSVSYPLSHPHFSRHVTTFSIFQTLDEIGSLHLILAHDMYTELKSLLKLIRSAVRLNREFHVTLLLMLIAFFQAGWPVFVLKLVEFVIWKLVTLHFQPQTDQVEVRKAMLNHDYYMTHLQVGNIQCALGLFEVISEQAIFFRSTWNSTTVRRDIPDSWRP